MANWGNVKIGKSMRVVSHERVEDTDPETYCNRGQHFSEQGKYLEAEQEYLKAVKLSGKNDGYVEKLLRFYYSTKRKDFEQKANKLYHAWWWRQGENQVFFYFIMCVICYTMTYTGFSGNGVSGLIWTPFMYMYLSRGPMERKQFIHESRGEWGLFILRIVVPVFAFIVCVLIVETAEYDSALKQFLWRLDSCSILNKIIGIGGTIGCIIAFNKGVPVLQDGVSQWKEGFFKNIFRKFLRWARIGGTLYLILILIGGMFGRINW